MLTTMNCDRRSLLALAAALLGCEAVHGPAAEELRPFAVGLEALDQNGGHVQGIAAAPDALYVSQQSRLVKLDWTGRVLKTCVAPVHTGDIFWCNGRLYAALARGGKGFIRIYDAELNLKREREVERGIDGIAVLDGVVYLGMGSKTQPSKNPHRVNILGRFDAETLEEIAPRAEFDYGYETKYGFQNITTDGKLLYGSFYAVVGAPQIVAFDRDLHVLATHRLPANQGLDVLPAAVAGEGRVMFIRGKTHLDGNKKIASCSFDFFPLDELEWK